MDNNEQNSNGGYPTASGLNMQAEQSQRESGTQPMSLGNAFGPTHDGQKHHQGQKAKNKRLTVILICIAAVLLVAVGGFLLWSVLNENKIQKDDNKSNQTQSNMDRNPQSPDTSEPETSQPSTETPVAIDPLTTLSNNLVSVYKQTDEYKKAVAEGVIEANVSYKLRSFHTGSVDGSISAVMDISYNPGATNGIVGLFYRNSVDADWQYFMSTQNTFVCSDFNTANLQQAFYYSVCDSNAGVTTVGTFWAS